jgi:hypothetical protein
MAVNNLNTPGVGIQPSLIDAKGDLLVGTADDAIDRLGVTGTTGAVLTADAGETTGLKWAAAGSVGGLVHIETVDTGGNVTSISVDDCFSADYTNYKIIVDLIGTGAQVSLDMRLRVSGTDNSASNYTRQNINANDGTLTSSRTATTTAWGTAPGQVSSTEKNMAILEIANPFQTTFTSAMTLRMNSVSGSIQGAIGYFGTTVTTSYTGFSIIAPSNQINGKITVLGYKI